MKKLLTVLGILLAIALAVGLPTGQENPAHLFMSDAASEKLGRLKADFGASEELVFVSHLGSADTASMAQMVEGAGGEFSDLKALLPGHAVLAPPPGKEAGCPWFRKVKMKLASSSITPRSRSPSASRSWAQA